ncbi:putative myosin-14 [Roseibium sp. TrichSKD4]|uniref:hypothetical protein n=1 Tax=Roseibium sp. TrichSKD4 TaxID=744980 RepID=UPI0001E56E2B|nr:hypothetical protein [Roseibium sp. TrichSKD4]EFO31574.1 putative myosin-14 [Roseibium sp. TrichSKD4]
MIEAAMYIALGFLFAGLIALAVFPAFYRRAVRLTREAYEAVNPTTYAEVRASQDQMLAQHAVERRRLERAVSEERNRTADEKLVAGNLRSELVRIKSENQRELEKLRQLQQQTDTDNKTASDQLLEEIAALKKQLQEATKSANGYRAEVDALNAAQPLPSSDTPSKQEAAQDEEIAEVVELQKMLSEAQAAEKGIELIDIDPADQSRVIKDLEKQLINIEAKYIAAQSHVAQLVALQDMAGAPSEKISSSLENNLKEAIEDKARLQAMVSDRERALKRAHNKLLQYRTDLQNASKLTKLRSNLVAFAQEQLPEADRAKLKITGNGAQKSDSDQSPENGAASSSDLPSPASVLVQKIVKANSGKSINEKPDRQRADTTSETNDDSPVTEEAVAAQKSERSSRKQKNKDVA